jgi:formylglycine-generating enzyme required for sulfatase activity
MRVAEFRRQPDGPEAPAQELVAALGQATRTVILGEPGSGKSTALERLAWVTATATLAESTASAAMEQPLVVPILARLADYQGERALTMLLRRALNRSGALALDDDLAVRQVLRVKNVRWVLLLDGLNEFDQAQRASGVAALRGHLDDYPRHTLHLTCRTADFDADRDTPPNAQVWNVQPLVDTIRYWDDAQGESDLRIYLRRHLGENAGKRLYARLAGDERLHSLARLPLFLWMFKETAGDAGELPADRGSLVRKFVRSRRLLGRTPKAQQERCERGLEALGWWLQSQRQLEAGSDTLYAQLSAPHPLPPADPSAVVQELQSCGLLLDLGEGRYRLLHQLVQEYAAAAYLTRQADCPTRLAERAEDETWRETVILALWLRADLHTPAYLQRLMSTPAVDLRVRVAAAQVLAQVGDPRFAVPADRPEPAYIEPTMIPIPGGQAVLGGADPDGETDEVPECTVPIASFALAVYPVTNAEYGCFIAAGGYADTDLWLPAGRAWLRGEGKLDAETEKSYRDLHRQVVADVEGWIADMRRTQSVTDEDADLWRTIAASWSEDEFVDAYAQALVGEQRREPVRWSDSRFNGKNQPVIGINWYEAQAYAAWLAQVTGQPYGLPSEAEWEWAARRKSPTTAGRRYPWGDDWDAARCNANESRLGQPSPVGLYPHGATPDGLHDLAGNVYEWTTTLYRPYPYGPSDGREEPLADGLRVMRGGSWYVGSGQVRCAYRHWYDPRYGNNHLGFRLARSLS